MKLNKVMKAAQHRVCGGSDFLWTCFGPNARWMEFSDFEDREISDAVYDIVTNRVYQINVYIPGTNDDRCATWIDPEFEHAYVTEARERGINPYQAWDDVMYSTIPGSEENMILDLLNDASEGTYDHFPSALYYAKYTDDQSGDRAVFTEHVGADDAPVELGSLGKPYVAQFTVRYTMAVDAENISAAAAQARKILDSFTDYVPATVTEVISESIGST